MSSPVVPLKIRKVVILTLYFTETDRPAYFFETVHEWKQHEPRTLCIVLQKVKMLLFECPTWKLITKEYLLYVSFALYYQFFFSWSPNAPASFMALTVFYWFEM